MKNKLPQELINEQNSIVDDKSKVLVVSACPGSGKTYTITKKIQKILNENVMNKNIIACTFGKEASNEIKNRLKKVNISNSLISTLDSFILQFILSFKNRCLMNSKFLQEILKNFDFKQLFFKEPTTFENSNLKYKNYFLDKKNEIYKNLNYEQNIYWIKSLYNEKKYIVSPSSYIFSVHILENVCESREYLKNNFSHFFIDEAQDMNKYQTYFIKKIYDICNINLVLVGDPNQCIFQFRGSENNLFIETFKNELGFNQKFLNYSCRCHPSIFTIASKIYDNKFKMEFDELRIEIVDSYENILEKIKDEKFIVLCRRNETCVNFFEKSKNIVTLNLSSKLILNENFSGYQHYIDEILYFFYNWKNISKFSYSIDDLAENLKIWNFNRKLKCPQNEKKSLDYIKYVFKDFLFIDDELFFKYLDSCDQLEDEKTISFYKRSDQNKIMTFHSSKGLESDIVILILDEKIFTYNNEEKNLLYVSITRAKEQVYIFFMDNRNENKNYYNLKKEIINLLNS